MIPTARPAPEHRLVRDGQPAPRLFDRRQTRPDQAYRCSCGHRYRGTTSRRSSRYTHQAHRADALGIDQ